MNGPMKKSSLSLRHVSEHGDADSRLAATPIPPPEPPISTIPRATIAIGGATGPKKSRADGSMVNRSPTSRRPGPASRPPTPGARGPACEPPGAGGAPPLLESFHEHHAQHPARPAADLMLARQGQARQH